MPIETFSTGNRVVATIGGHFGERPLSLELSREIAVDPGIVEHYARNRANLKPWVEPSLSSHLWTAPLPEHLSSGIHRIAITITNEYGQVNNISRLLEVQGRTEI